MYDKERGIENMESFEADLLETDLLEADLLRTDCLEADLPETEPAGTGSFETGSAGPERAEAGAAETEQERIRGKAAMRRREWRREKQNRERYVRAQLVVLAAVGSLLLLMAGTAIAKRIGTPEEKAEKEAQLRREEIEAKENELLSDSVLQYRDLVEYYAEEEGIEEYVPVLLAIMEAETGGERDDVMQSSESAGLEPNTLGPEDSIAQACDYFRGLVDRAEDMGCDTKSIIQAYNFGPGYLYYVAEHGGKHSFDLAVDYAEKMSDGRTAAYTHYIADDNGNWMYLYGNMYYVKLVEQYLP